MEDGDDWIALDKLYHVLFCFFISVVISSLAMRTRYPFLSRWSISIGSLVSMAAGAAKEAGDEIGLWKSAGASTKDAIADLFGILLAYLCLSFYRSFSSPPTSVVKKEDEELELIRRISVV